MCDIAKQDAELKQKCQEQQRKATNPMEKLRCSILSRGSGSINAIGRVFRAMDDDRSWSLSFEEFKTGLLDYGVPVSDDEAKSVFDYLDKDGGGSLNYDEFLVALKPPMSESRKAILSKAFKSMDKTGDGVITAADLIKVYNARRHPKYLNGQWTEKQVFDEFLKSFEAPESVDGKVTQEEFFNYYAGVSASIDDDAYFDLMIRNAWKL